MIRLPSLSFRWLAAAPLLGAAAAAAWGALPSSTPAVTLEESELAREACLNRFEGFRKTVSWYAAGNSARIDAEDACASRRGTVYDLRDVTLEVRTGKRQWSRIRTHRATYAPRLNRIVFDPSTGDSQGCLSAAARRFPVVLDLATGELKTSGHRIWLDRKNVQGCGAARG